MSQYDAVPPSYEQRLAALEARVLALEARLGQLPPSPRGATAPLDPGDTGAWLTEVAALAARGDRAGAVALYEQNMGSGQQEAAAFVDDLIAHPPPPG